MADEAGGFLIVWMSEDDFGEWPDRPSIEARNPGRVACACFPVAGSGPEASGGGDAATFGSRNNSIAIWLVYGGQFSPSKAPKLDKTAASVVSWQPAKPNLIPVSPRRPRPS